MSLYFITTKNGTINSFYSTSNGKCDLLHSAVDWRKSDLLENNIPVNDHTVDALGRVDEVLGYIDGKLVTKDLCDVKVDGETLTTITPFKARMTAGKHCHYIINLNNVCRIGRDGKVKTVHVYENAHVYNGEVYINIDKDLYRLEGEDLNNVLVHKYSNDIYDITSTSKGLVVRCSDGIYCNHELLIPVGSGEDDNFVCTNKYIIIENKLYDVEGQLLYILGNGMYFTNIVDEYAVIKYNYLFYIPEEKVVYATTEELIPYYV